MKAGLCGLGMAAVRVLSMRNTLLFAALTAIVSSSATVAAQNQPGANFQGQAQLAIIDTDIGDDIDDAFALALALKSPELKILGVTTAFGDTDLRARLVDRYLTAVGRGDIPIAAGVPTQHTNNVFTQAAYAQRWPSGVHADGVE